MHEVQSSISLLCKQEEVSSWKLQLIAKTDCKMYTRIIVTNSWFYLLEGGQKAQLPPKPSDNYSTTPKIVSTVVCKIVVIHQVERW